MDCTLINFDNMAQVATSLSGLSYYVRLIGPRMRSIKWRYFQRLLVIPNYPKPPHFESLFTSL